MATWESDETPLGSPGHIRVPRFRTVRRGFAPNEVMEYLAWVSDHVEALESRVGHLKSVSETDARGVDASVTDMVRTLDHVERLRREADQIVAEARAEAERIRVDSRFQAEAARADAQRTLWEAQKVADKTLSDLESRREAVRSEVQTIRDDMLYAVKGLEATIELAGDRRWRS